MDDLVRYAGSRTGLETRLIQRMAGIAVAGGGLLFAARRTFG